MNQTWGISSLILKAAKPVLIFHISGKSVSDALRARTQVHARLSGIILLELTAAEVLDILLPP